MTTKLKVGDLDPDKGCIEPTSGHDAWFRREVQCALDKANAPGAVLIPDEQMQRWFDELEQELDRQARDQERRHKG